MLDILSEADAGTGNRKVDGSRLPLDDLIGRFALRPRVSLNVTVDGGGGGRERKEERKILFGSPLRNEEERGEDRGGKKNIYVFDLYSFYTHGEK